MKTSNKILLGFLLISLFIFISVHAAIYIKYKNGAYTGVNANEFSKSDHQFKNIKYIIVENVSVDLNYSDAVRLQLTERKDPKFKNIEYVQRGDSLIVIKKANKKNEWYNPVQLYINKDIIVNAKESSLSITSTTDSSMAPSYVLNLERSSFNIGFNLNHSIYLDSLKINAGKDSHISLNNSIVLNAEISLKEARLNLDNTRIDQLKLKNDRSSTVFITGSSVSDLQNQ